jgi:hypothetical protein
VLGSGQILVKAIEKRKPTSTFKKSKVLKEDVEELCEALGEVGTLLQTSKDQHPNLDTDTSKKPERG